MEQKNVYKKIFEAKKSIGKISKDSKNPFFKSNYLSLNGLIEAITPSLEENGLILIQPIEAEWVKTKIVDNETGEYISSEIHLPSIQDPQKLGSAITYYRRYTLQSLLGLQVQDDDGNNAAIKLSNKPIDHTRNLTRINACITLKGLKKVWESFTSSERQEKVLIDAKNKKYHEINTK